MGLRRQGEVEEELHELAELYVLAKRTDEPGWICGEQHNTPKHVAALSQPKWLQLACFKTPCVQGLLWAAWCRWLRAALGTLAKVGAGEAVSELSFCRLIPHPAVVQGLCVGNREAVVPPASLPNTGGSESSKKYLGVCRKCEIKKVSVQNNTL